MVKLPIFLKKYLCRGCFRNEKKLKWLIHAKTIMLFFIENNESILKLEEVFYYNDNYLIESVGGNSLNPDSPANKRKVPSEGSLLLAKVC